jgi:hypothetical protein
VQAAKPQPAPPAEWTFLQCFGERHEGEEVHEGVFESQAVLSEMANICASCSAWAAVMAGGAVSKALTAASLVQPQMNHIVLWAHHLGLEQAKCLIGASAQHCSKRCSAACVAAYAALELTLTASSCCCCCCAFHVI